MLPGEVMGTRRHHADPIMVFEFSAATWNPHRLHYDADYARAEENHPAALVQGPLQGALLEDFASAWAVRHGSVLSRLRYRHTAPAHVGDELIVTGRVEEVNQEKGEISVALWIESRGNTTTTGSAVIEWTREGD